MIKKIMLRGFLGLPIGITLGYLITIVISLGWGNGVYIACMPELVGTVGSESGAVLLQAFFCGVLGVGFAACSIIWEIDTWSLVKQTAIYFLIVSFLMLPIAYFSFWMEHSILGFLIYYGIFVGIFLMIWIIQYFCNRTIVKKMNAELHCLQKKEEKEKTV